MDFAELIINLEAELSKFRAILENLQEQINELKAFAQKQGFLEQHFESVIPTTKNKRRI